MCCDCDPDPPCCVESDEVRGFFALSVGRAHSHEDFLQYKLPESNYNNTITEGHKDVMSFKVFFVLSRVT